MESQLARSLVNYIVIPAKQEMEVKMADKKLRITLVKSPISAVPKHRRTVEAMGLTKMHKTVELPDNAATRGQIQQIGYMLKVEEI